MAAAKIDFVKLLDRLRVSRAKIGSADLDGGWMSIPSTRFNDQL